MTKTGPHLFFTVGVGISKLINVRYWDYHSISSILLLQCTSQLHTRFSHFFSLVTCYVFESHFQDKQITRWYWCKHKHLDKLSSSDLWSVRNKEVSLHDFALWVRFQYYIGLFKENMWEFCQDEDYRNLRLSSSPYCNFT